MPGSTATPHKMKTERTPVAPSRGSVPIIRLMLSCIEFRIRINLQPSAGGSLNEGSGTGIYEHDHIRQLRA